MKQVRQGVFETNSSSTHVLHISKTFTPDKYNDLQADWDGDLVIDSDAEFGHEFSAYSDARVKASYVGILLSQLKEWSERVSEPEHNYAPPPISDWGKEHFAQCRQNFVEVLKEQVDFKRLEIPSDHIKIKGYIDHQSAEEVKHFSFLLDKESIRRFIFDNSSLLLTGNDNQYHRWEIVGDDAVLKHK